MKRTRLYKLSAAAILLGLLGLAASLVSSFRRQNGDPRLPTLLATRARAREIIEEFGPGSERV